MEIVTMEIQIGLHNIETKQKNNIFKNGHNIRN